jgi:hypothetical protein
MVASVVYSDIRGLVVDRFSVEAGLGRASSGSIQDTLDRPWIIVHEGYKFVYSMGEVDSLFKPPGIMN